jgi:hypothetical protein
VGCRVGGWRWSRSGRRVCWGCMSLCRWCRGERRRWGAGFETVRTVGALLPADLLARVVAGGDLPGLRSEDCHLAGEPLRQAASRAYEYLRGAYARFTDGPAARRAMRRPG